MVILVLNSDWRGVTLSARVFIAFLAAFAGAAVLALYYTIAIAWAAAG